jgi:flagellar biosynthesis protein
MDHFLKKQAVKAVALRHDMDSQQAPVVAAKGVGLVAEEILRISKEYNIPIKQDRDLVEILYRIDMESQIPRELFLVVAEMLAFLYLSTCRFQEETAQAFGNLGTVMYTQGDFEMARDHWIRARSIFSTLGKTDKVKQLDILIHNLPNVSAVQNTDRTQNQ